MQQALFHAHSGLRFLVLLAAVIAIAVLAWGWARRRGYTGASPASVTLFVGVLDLQVVIGVALTFLSPFYGALMGHLVMMLAAAAAVHALSAYARRRADGRQAHAIALAGVAVALLLVVGGIMAIRPGGPFHITPAPLPAEAAG
jgi:hypothetical protein